MSSHFPFSSRRVYEDFTFVHMCSCFAWRPVEYLYKKASLLVDEKPAFLANTVLTPVILLASATPTFRVTFGDRDKLLALHYDRTRSVRTVCTDRCAVRRHCQLDRSVTVVLILELIYCFYFCLSSIGIVVVQYDVVSIAMLSNTIRNVSIHLNLRKCRESARLLHISSRHLAHRPFKHD